MTEPARTLTNEELIAVAALWKRTGREFITRFTGTSMRPTIDSASEVLLKCDSTVNLGDVIAYCVGEQLIVHRVVALSRDGEWLIARGDAAIVPDPLVVPLRAVAGTIVAVNRNGTFCEPGSKPRLSFFTFFVDTLCRALVRNDFLRRRVLRRFLRVARFLTIRLKGKPRPGSSKDDQPAPAEIPDGTLR